MKTIQSPKLIDYFWLILLSAIWGSAFVSISFALNDFSPLAIAFGRIFMASLFLLVFVFLQKLSFPRDLKTWLMLILIGMLNNAMPFYLISWGQQYISPSTASVMLAVGPFIALIASHYITNDEKITVFKLLSVFLGFVGIFILLGDDFLLGQVDSLYGKLAMLVAVMGYITSGFLIRKLYHVPTLVCSTSMFMTASVMLFPFVMFLPFEGVSIINTSFFVIVYLAIIPTATASLIRIELVQKVGVQFMSQVAYLIPMFAILWSWIFFDEIPSPLIIIALTFIFLGLFVRRFTVKNKKV